MANFRTMNGGNVGVKIDMDTYIASTSVSSIASGSTFTLTVPQKPKLVLVTYLLTTTASIYCRNDLCDIENNKVFVGYKGADDNTYNTNSATITDEVSYSGTTLTIKNKTSATRLMGAVAFY